MEVGGMTWVCIPFFSHSASGSFCDSFGEWQKEAWVMFPSSSLSLSERILLEFFRSKAVGDMTYLTYVLFAIQRTVLFVICYDSFGKWQLQSWLISQFPSQTFIERTLLEFAWSMAHGGNAGFRPFICHWEKVFVKILLVTGCRRHESCHCPFFGIEWKSLYMIRLVNINWRYDSCLCPILCH